MAWAAGATTAFSGLRTPHDVVMDDCICPRTSFGERRKWVQEARALRSAWRFAIWVLDMHEGFGVWFGCYGDNIIMQPHLDKYLLGNSLAAGRARQKWRQSALCPRVLDAAGARWGTEFERGGAACLFGPVRHRWRQARRFLYPGFGRGRFAAAVGMAKQRSEMRLSRFWCWSWC